MSKYKKRALSLAAIGIVLVAIYLIVYSGEYGTMETDEGIAATFSIIEEPDTTILSIGEQLHSFTLVDIWSTSEDGVTYESARLEGTVTLVGTLHFVEDTRSFLFEVDEEFLHNLPLIYGGNNSPRLFEIFDFQIAAGRPDLGALMLQNRLNMAALCGTRAAFETSHIITTASPNSYNMLVGAFTHWIWIPPDAYNM